MPETTNASEKWKNYALIIMGVVVLALVLSRYTPGNTMLYLLMGVLAFIILYLATQARKTNLDAIDYVHKIAERMTLGMGSDSLPDDFTSSESWNIEPYSQTRWLFENKARRGIIYKINPTVPAKSCIVGWETISMEQLINRYNTGSIKEYISNEMKNQMLKEETATELEKLGLEE